MNNRHFYPDFIRAFATCLIMVYHFDLHALETRTAESLLFGNASNSFGHYGISLFIILSGATLMLNYERNFNVLTYLKKRFFHIYPLFWITYLFFFAARLVFDHSIPEAHLWTFLLTIGAMDGFMLYKLPNFYIMGEWYLGMIIILYLIFPFLRTVFLKYRYFTLLSCVCLVVLIQRFYQFDMDVSRFPLSRLLEFVLGMSFIRLFDDSENNVLNFLLIGIAGVLFYYVSALNLPFLLKMPAVGIIAFTGLASVSRLFSCPICRTIIRFLSSYSYGAFLSHHVIIVRVTNLFQNKHLAFLPECLLLCLCLVLAYGLSFMLTNFTKIVVSRAVQKSPFRQV